jgi:hypothetical protein
MRAALDHEIAALDHDVSIAVDHVGGIALIGNKQH